MSGIAGMVMGRGGFADRTVLDRMLAGLNHRGPDGQGFAWCAESADGRVESFVEQTLETGTWPARGPAAAIGRAVLGAGHPSGPPAVASYRTLLGVLDGEIHNATALRAMFPDDGQLPPTADEGAILLAVYAHLGPSGLARVLGGFALAIIDPGQRTLVLARDPYSVKPLFYATVEGGAIFASEIRALYQWPGLSRRVDAKRLYDYLETSNTDHGDATLFRAVRQVRAGYALTIPFLSPSAPLASRYHVQDLGGDSGLSITAAARELRERFLESVSLHLRSDPRLGFALSGGVDSSSIVAVARHLRGARLEMHGFTCAAGDGAPSELRFAEAVASGSDITLHTWIPDVRELPADFNHLLDVQGEPFTSPTIWAQHRLLRLAGELEIPAMFGGQGSDEMLGSYDWVMGARLASLTRAGRWFEALRFVLASGGIPGRGRAAMLRAWLGATMPGSLRSALGRQRPAAYYDYMDADWFRTRGVEPAEAGTERVNLRQRLHRTFAEAHLQAMLRFEDRNAMAASIETRMPFLAPSVVDFIFTLPEQYIISRDGSRKSVFRLAMRGLTQDAVLDRRDKIGFAMPVAEWLIMLKPWVEARLDVIRGIRALRPEAVDRQWRGVREGRSTADAFLLWRWISLATWIERYGVEIG